jgi:hypothetical protein
MGAKLVETELPVDCTWCGSRLHVFLGVQESRSGPDNTLILCPSCDGTALPLIRRRVVALGHLEERHDVLVWVQDRGPGEPG